MEEDKQYYAKVHSIESFGTVDGPGIRFVLFLQGCHLQCKYCHNRDTWDIKGGDYKSLDDIFEKIKRYKNYMKLSGGGVTATGGEPLLQVKFLKELFKKLKEEGIHTCIDTSGIFFDETNTEVVAKYDELLKVCDLFLLDIKHIEEDKHIQLTGLSSKKVKAFAKYLSDRNKPVWIRHVLVDGYTNNEADLLKTKAFIDTLNNVEKIEVLPYHTMGLPKYNQLGIAYPLKDTKAPSKESVAKAKEILGVKQYVNK